MNIHFTLPTGEYSPSSVDSSSISLRRDPTRDDSAETGSAQLSAGIVMLIDDNEALLEVMAEVLKVYNVKVKCFTDPMKAIDWHRAFGADVDLVLLDMCNPIMHAEECYPALMESDHTLPVILMSAGWGMDIVNRLLSDGAMCFLRKPFNCVYVAEGVVRWFESAGRYVGPDRENSA